jgi:hypothetical protein
METMGLGACFTPNSAQSTADAGSTTLCRLAVHKLIVRTPQA